jgi:hypothetical protein
VLRHSRAEALRFNYGARHRAPHCEQIVKKKPRCSAALKLGTLDEARAHAWTRSTITRRDDRERMRMHCYTARPGGPTKVTIKRNENLLAQSCRFCAKRPKHVEYPTRGDTGGGSGRSVDAPLRPPNDRLVTESRTPISSMPSRASMTLGSRTGS